MYPNISVNEKSSTEDGKIIATIKYQVDDGVRFSSEHAWNRGYTVTPTVRQITMDYPLHDLRKAVSEDADQHGEPQDIGWSWSRSAAVLKKFGFTTVKFDPKWAKADDEVKIGDYDDLETLERTYFPEVKDAISKLTGARKVFITNSIVRRGDASAAVNKSGPEKVTSDGNGKKAVPDNYRALDDTRPTHLASSDNSRPARGAHVDYTSLGARRAIRRWRPDILKAATEAGVIAAEDQICAEAHVDAQERESNPFIEEKYNANGKLGPRYSAYSVWRPMRTVTRDPLAMAPRWTFPKGGVLGFLGYESRMLAAPSMGGDFLRELESVTVSQEAADAYEGSNGTDVARGLESPQWYYVPEQKADEVVVLKFWDSAALGNGNGSGEAGGTPHASPDLGEAAYGPARWSIEVRCIAFW